MLTICINTKISIQLEVEMNESQISLISEFVTYMNRFDSNYCNWYVGIASDARDRLFNGHQVREQGIWIFNNAGSEASAREIEKYFINTLKTQGGSGGGDNNTTMVYAYLISNTTIQ